MPSPTRASQAGIKVTDMEKATMIETMAARPRLVKSGDPMKKRPESARTVVMAEIRMALPTVPMVPSTDASSGYPARRSWR